MYQVSDIRKGLKIEMDGKPYNVVDFQFVKPGKGQAFTRTRLKNLMTGAVIEHTFKIVESLTPADVEEQRMTYLYRSGEDFACMNSETFEQMDIPARVFGDQAAWLQEEMPISVLFFKGAPISAEIPNFVDLQITYCEPGARGNTATGTMKPATVSSGGEVMVPLFIENGEWIRIDTRDGSYSERVKK